MLAAAAFALGTAETADGATPTPAPTPTSATGTEYEPGTYILYTGSGTRTDTDSDGVTHPADPLEFSTGIHCDEGHCAVFGIPWFPTGIDTTIVGTTAHFLVPAVGDVCADTGRRAIDVSLAFTPTGLTGTIDQPGVGWVDCQGTQTYFWGIHIDLVGAFASGDACVLDGVACPPTPTPTPAPVAASGDSGIVFWSPRPPAAPTVLSSLATPAETLSVQQAAWAAALTVVLVILVALPTQVFNSASERAADRVGAWWRRRRGADAAPAGAGAVTGDGATVKGWFAAAAGVLLASVISAFVDPAFGFDVPSLRMLVSILLSFAVDVALGWFAIVWLVRRLHPGAVPNFEFKPLTLFVVVGAVVFTRLTGFQPGIVFGLVAGVAFGAVLATAERARIALVGLGWAFVIAIVGWIGYALLAGAGDGFFAVFARETLGSIAAAGIAALPIALFPLRGLAGGLVFAWNRWVWAACYAVGLLGFFLVLMPMPTSWTSVPVSLWAWLGVYLAYAAVAVGVWLWIVQPWKREPEPQSGPEAARLAE